MTTCINCRTLVELLKREIEDLNDREEKLSRMNSALMEAMTNTESRDNYEGKGWKQKYEEQVGINLELQKRIKQMSKTADSNSLCSSSLIEDPFRYDDVLQREGCKENYRSGSVSKMDKLMKTFGSSMARQSTAKGRNVNTICAKSHRQIVLRIVDDRLNRYY